MNDALDWLFGVLEGDFNEDPSTSQIVVGALITAIPFVDQLADIRDIIANLRKVHDKPDDKWAWIALVITLIGLIPVVGSLLKGVFKILAKGIKKGAQYADETLNLILAAVRAAGKGDPVQYLKNLPWKDYTQSVLNSFKKITSTLSVAVSDLQHRWIARKLLGPEQIAKMASQIDMLQKKGYDQIPKVMSFLRSKLDELLERAKPANLKGSSGATNTLKHSEKPLLRLEYEVASKRMNDQIEAMRKSGKSKGEIAEYAVKERRRLQADARKKTDPDIAKLIEVRNKRRYNHPDGPNAKRGKDGIWRYEQAKKTEGQRSAIHYKNKKSSSDYEIKTKTDDEMIEGAMKTGGDDFPWQLVLELSRAKKAGDKEKAQKLLQEIKRIMKL